MPTIKELQDTKGVKSLDSLNANEQDLLAVALGAPARQVLLRAEEVGPRTGWRDGYLSKEHGFVPPDSEAAAGALAKSPGRVWSDLCERMPGCVARGRVRESIAALPLVKGTEDVIPDKALWAALVALGMLCSIYRYEDKHNGSEGVNVVSSAPLVRAEMSDDLGDEVKGIPKSIGLPFYQISKRMGRSIPHLTFFDQSSYNVRIRDPTSVYPYLGRFDNMDLRWPMFGDQSEIAFLKGCADTSGKLVTPKPTDHWFIPHSFFPTWSRCHCKLSGARYEQEQRRPTPRAHSTERDPGANAQCVPFHISEPCLRRKLHLACGMGALGEILRSLIEALPSYIWLTISTVSGHGRFPRPHKV